MNTFCTLKFGLTEGSKSGCEVLIPGALPRLSPKCLANLGTRLDVGIGAGLGAINIPQQDSITHTITNATI